VRAGLTPKFKDVDNLVDMLTYSTGGPVIDAGAYNSDEPEVIRYTPPVPEFEVMMVHIDPGTSLERLSPGVPAILIILEGSGELDGKLCRPGRSYYWPANAPPLHFTVDASRRGPMKVAIAHKNCHIDRPTAVNREDFGGYSSHHRLSVPQSPMPYLGMGGSTPTNQSKKEASPGGTFLGSNAMPNLSSGNLMPGFLPSL
jgi:quercetin dioxygenase-like cupin family protein